MNALRRQFFLSYGVIGSVMPLMSVFLWKEGGFSLFQIGLATALANVPMLVSPGLITLLADRNVDSRRILAAAFFVSVTVFALMHAVDSAPARLALFLFHGLAFVAMMPLQDGFFFSHAERLRSEGLDPPAYPLVRVWGTIGFIVPSVIIYFLLLGDAPVSRVLLCAMGFGAASFFNTFTLPKAPRAALSDASGSGSGSGKVAAAPGPAAPARPRLPTSEAFRELISPRARYLCLALALAYMASVTYYTFISIYFREVIGIPDRFIGLVINLGVVIEIFFTLAMPRLQAALRLKGIMIAGLACMALRMILLAWFPSVWTAILTQALHGMEVLALFIAPVMFLDRLAGDRFRNSIQGMFTMTVGGVSRVAGAVVAGAVASAGLDFLLAYAAGLTLLALAVVAFKFQHIPPPRRAAEAPPGPLPPATGADAPPVSPP